MRHQRKGSRRFFDLMITLGVVTTMSFALGAPPDGKGGGGGGKPGGGGGEDPPPSPDIVYMNGDVMLMNFDGSNQRPLYTGGFSGGAPAPAISADGSMVVMMAEIAGIKGVYTIRTDGTDLRLVAPLLMSSNPNYFRAAFSPVPAPDGEYKIAFSDQTEIGSFHTDIWLVNLDGSELQNLTDGPGGKDYPAWSIDGTRIVAPRNSQLLGHGLILYELGLDVNGDVTIVAETNLNEAGPLAGVRPRTPAWANTQDLIVATAFLSTGYHLWLIDPADPASPTQLTFGTNAETFATFTPDDSKVIFNRDGSRNGIMELDAFGNLQKLTKAHPHSPNARRFDPAP